MLSGILLDLDGTLIDTNRHHVAAWVDAFEERGYRVAPDRVLGEVGKGGDRLVADVLGHEAERKDGDELRALQAKAFAKRAETSGIKLMPGAETLLALLRSHGLKTALATSSSSEHLDVVEQASGVVWRVLFDEVVGKDDIDKSKPSPDVVSVAAERLHLHPAQCALIGDAPWDARAAVRGGLVTCGVTCGGNSEETLRRAGARLVLRDPAEIADGLEVVLKSLSPGSAKLDADMLAQLMRHALHVAEEGMLAGEVPIGAVLAQGDGTIIGRGYNRYNESGDAAQHAELVAFAQAAGAIDRKARDTILVSTLEPCVMCTGAAMEMAVDTVVYGLTAPADSGSLRVQPPQSPENQMPRIVGRVLERDSRALFEQWLERPMRNVEQEPYVKQLLATT